MSLCYWTIEGVGIDTYEIEKNISNEKLALFLIGQFRNEPEEVKRLQVMLDNGDYDGLNIRDYLYGEPFENIADILCHCDDTNSLTFGDDGQSTSYLFYPPKMPWLVTGDDPKCIEEVHERIVAAVQKLTDMTAEAIKAIIDDDLHVSGCG